MDPNVSKSISSLADETNLLAETIFTTTFMLRQLNSRKLKFKECVPILEILQKEMQSTVTELKEIVNGMGHDAESQMRGTMYLDKVGVVVADIPQFVSILNKYPKGTPELDEYTVKILGQFSQLGGGFSAIATVTKNQNVNNKM